MFATPSPEDNELTRRLKTIAELVGIRLLDHIIVANGTNTWISMQQIGVI
jgi:DNA repair protein RadC